MKREDAQSSPLRGTHASKSVHWHRGFLRNQHVRIRQSAQKTSLDRASSSYGWRLNHDGTFKNITSDNRARTGSNHTTSG